MFWIQWLYHNKYEIRSLAYNQLIFPYKPAALTWTKKFCCNSILLNFKLPRERERECVCVFVWVLERDRRKLKDVKTQKVYSSSFQVCLHFPARIFLCFFQKTAARDNGKKATHTFYGEKELKFTSSSLSLSLPVSLSLTHTHTLFQLEIKASIFSKIEVESLRRKKTEKKKTYFFKNSFFSSEKKYLWRPISLFHQNCIIWK